MKLCWAMKLVRGGKFKTVARFPTKKLARANARSWGRAARVVRVCKR